MTKDKSLRFILNMIQIKHIFADLPNIPSHLIFLGILIFFGLPLVFLTPPFQTPDEYAHFYRAYALTDLDFTSMERPMPKSIALAAVPVNKLPAHPEEKIRVQDLLPAWKVPVDETVQEPIYYGSAMAYPPLIYLPQVIGIAVGRFLRLPLLGLLVTGRLFNLFFFALLGTVTLRLMPSHRWLLTTLLLLPMLVFLSASLSPDILTVGLSLVFIAYILRLTSNEVKQIGWPEIGWLAFLSILLGLIKMPYFLIALCIFIIPPQKFGSKKDYFLMLTLVFGVVILTVLTIQLPIAFKMGHTITAAEINHTPLQKLEEQIYEPLTFLSMFYHTIRQFLIIYIFGFIGVIGWNETLLPLAAYAGSLIVLAGLVFIDGNRSLRLNIFQRFLMLAVFGLIFFTVHLLLYLGYTPPESVFIQGVQGRYFIPFALLLFMPFSSSFDLQKLRPITTSSLIFFW